MQDQKIAIYTNIVHIDFFLILGLSPLKKQRALIDFPLPNEMIEIMIAFLSSSDLLALAAVGTERIKHYSLSFLETKLHGKYLLCGSVKCYNSSL